MTARNIFIFILILITIGLALAIIEPAHAQDCNVFLDDDLISDSTVPYPNSEHCDGNGQIRLVCQNVEVTAFLDGYFYLVGDYDTEVAFEFYLSAGSVRTFSVPVGVEWLQLWYSQDLVGIVDISPQECSSDVAYPPDSRANWQQGDSFFAVYVDNGWVAVYATVSGEGVLILNTPEPACSEDGTACLYLLSDGSYQVNLIDPEGKLYEIGVQL